MPPPWGPDALTSLRRSLREGHDSWDLVVVGGGITGAGVARDAAMRGLRVLVLEAADIAYGTSSRSSRLVHGGVRYLEQGEFGLVFEALRERRRLYAAAPHLVRGARFLFPAYAGDRLGPWRLRLGLTLYDTLDLHRGEAHAFLGPEQTLQTEPLLARGGLRGAVMYEDAITDDARLTLATIQDARRHGAAVLTYAEVDAISKDGGAYRIALRDGAQVRAHAVVVATGPWTSGRLLGAAARELLALSKGIHVVMRSTHVPIRQPLVIQAPHQRRILFVVPWGTRTYLGTTDAPYDGDPGRSGVTETDEAELLDLVRRLLPNADLRPQNIVSAWSGVRPLVRSEIGRRGEPATSTVEMSRRHRLVRNEIGVIGIVGGKLTTYRAMAAEVVDAVVDTLGPDWPHQRPPPRSCTTHRRPLTTGTALRVEDLRDPLIADLASRHGPAARELAQRARVDPAAGQRLVADLPYRWCEVDHAIAYEGVTHLEDLLRRRLPLALTDPHLGGAVAREVARRLVDAWGGTAADVELQIDRYCEAVFTETRRWPPVP